MKKRGNLVTMMLFSILAAAFVMILFQNVAHALATNEQFFRQYQAYELKYMLHALYAIPGNSVVNYAGNTSGLNFDFQTNSITVSSSKINTKFEKGYALIIPFRASSVIKKFSDVKRLVFSKAGNNIYVDDKDSPRVDLLACPAAGEKFSKSVLIIEPKKGPQEAFLKTLADNLRNPASPFSVAKLLQQGGQIKDDDVLLQLTVGRYDSMDNPVKVFYRADNAGARRLACLIVDSIAQKSPVTGFSIIPSNDNSLAKGIGLRIVVGNGNIQPNPMLDAKTLTPAIKQAFQEW